MTSTNQYFPSLFAVHSRTASNATEKIHGPLLWHFIKAFLSNQTTSQPTSQPISQFGYVFALTEEVQRKIQDEEGDCVIVNILL